MHAKHTQFKIAQLKQDKLILAVESILIFFLSIFLSVFLPALILEYVYGAGVGLTTEPEAFKVIRVATFVLPVVFFLYAFGQSIMKMGQIGKLHKELEIQMMSDEGCSCGGDCGCGGHDHQHEMMIPEEMVIEKPRAKKVLARAKKI